MGPLTIAGTTVPAGTLPEEPVIGLERQFTEVPKGSLEDPGMPWIDEEQP